MKGQDGWRLDSLADGVTHGCLPYDWRNDSLAGWWNYRRGDSRWGTKWRTGWLTGCLMKFLTGDSPAVCRTTDGVNHWLANGITDGVTHAGGRNNWRGDSLVAWWNFWRVTHRLSAERLTEWLIDWLMKLPTGWLTLADEMTDGVTRWLADEMTGGGVTPKVG